MINQAQRLSILQEASNEYLTKPYPENWAKMSEPEQLDFIDENVVEHLEGLPTPTVRMIIEDAANLTIRNLERNNLTEDQISMIKDQESIFDNMIHELSDHISAESCALIRKGQKMFTKELADRGVDWSV